MKPEFILPFKGRDASRTYGHNFLWRYGSIYIMDNHGAALWCWLQHLDSTSKYELLHIDQHYDCLSSRIGEWLSALPPNLERLTFEEYQHVSHLLIDERTKIPVIRCDNYLSIFLKLYSDNINNCTFATHSKGEKPDWDNYREVSDFQLVSYVTHSLDEGNWIVNIDLDYFFYKNYEDKYKHLHSDEYIEELFEKIAIIYKAGRIAVLTLCLSPEWCEGWEPAESLVCKICKVLDLSFQLH